MCFDWRKRTRINTSAQIVSEDVILIPHLTKVLSFAFQSWKVHIPECGYNRLKDVVGDLQASHGRQQRSDFHRAAADCRIEYQAHSSCATVYTPALLFPGAENASSRPLQISHKRLTCRDLIRAKGFLRSNFIDPLDSDKGPKISVSNRRLRPQHNEPHIIRTVKPMGISVPLASLRMQRTYDTCVSSQDQRLEPLPMRSAGDQVETEGLLMKRLCRL